MRWDIGIFKKENEAPLPTDFGVAIVRISLLRLFVPFRVVQGVGKILELRREDINDSYSGSMFGVNEGECVVIVILALRLEMRSVNNLGDCG